MDLGVLVDGSGVEQLLPLAGGLLFVLFGVWVATAQAIYVSYFGYAAAANIPDFARKIFTTPEGWWLKTTPTQTDRGLDCFTLTIGDKPKDAALPIALRLTLTGGSGAMETTIQAGPKT